MRRVFIELDESAFEAIADKATAERRPTRDQIALVVEHAAKRFARQRGERPRPTLAAPAEVHHGR